MRVDVTVRCEQPLTSRMRQVCAMFDAPPEDKTTRSWSGELPIEERPWQVGLIVGPSGCGKSTIARNVFGEPATLTWDAERAVVDCVDSSFSIAAISEAFAAVGFNTIPAWLRPFAVLSNGERFRAELARVLLERGEGLVWVDEFTSVVDRQVAKIGSHAVQKYVRRQPHRRFVAVGCHYDVIDWLQPDWTLEPATMTFTWRSLQRRPPIVAELRRCPRSLWTMFAPYHYLTAELHRAAACFALYVDERPVAFAGIMPLPVSRGARAGEAIWRVSRVVTLPDWQGLGLAFVLMEQLGAAYKALGARLRNYPAHPSFVRAHARSSNWQMTRDAGNFGALPGVNGQRGLTGGRPCAVFEYVGAADPDLLAARRLIARG